MTLWALYWVLLLILPNVLVMAAPLQSVPGWAALQSTCVALAQALSLLTIREQFPAKPASLCAGIVKGWVVQGHYNFEIEAILPDAMDRKVPDVARVSYPAKFRREADFSAL
ncbi:hypothetical protein B0H19DRAFT_1155644 [Mycena capillaripes]|nr:hypothetical protein B0H19DRAFT_1155644 [Mycena capillaripes]